MADLSKIVCLEQDCRHGTEQTGSSGSGNDTYTKAEIDSKDAAVKAIADKAQSTAASAATAASNAQSTANSAKSTASSAAAAAADAQNVNKTQDGQITELQKAAHTHSNKDIIDKIEQPFTTADQAKLNSLENYEHPTHKANSKGFYKFASDDLGHVSETEAVTKKDITALGIPSENTRYKFTVDGTGLEINQSTSADFYRLKFPSVRSITSLIPYFPNTYDDGRGFCWCQLAFTVVESIAYDYKKIGIKGGYEQGERIYYKPQGVAKIAIALYGVAGRRGVSITADLPLHNAKLFEVRPLENLKIFSSAPEKKLSVYAVGRYNSIDTGAGGKTNYDLYLFLYADESYTATDPGVRVTVETSVYPFDGHCSDVNRNYSTVVQLDSSAISESIRMSAAKVEAVTDILANKADKSEIPDISGKQDKPTAGANTTLSGNTISAKDTTYSNATTSKAGLMSATDKTNLNANTLARHTHSNKATLDKLTDAQLTKLDGFEPDLYLPKAGGVMTGNIDLATNSVDLLVGTARAAQGTYASAVAGAAVAEKEPLTTGLSKRKSLIGSWLDQNSVWQNILSVRHRNGWNDGPSYGFYLRSLLTSIGDLCWNKQTGVDKWQGERVLLDSANYSRYAAPLSHTHRDIDQIGNVGYYGSDEANSDGWYKIYSGTLTGHADRVARLSIVRGYGRGHGIVLFHLRCDNSSSIKIHDLLWETRYKFDENHIAIKTNKNEYGIYVYQNSVQWGRIKVRVLESCGTSSNWTMTISNNSTKESSFTPTATGKDGSTVAKANEADTLTETAWTDVPETNISPRYGKNIKYLKSGNTVYVRGSISFSQSLNNPCCGTMPSDLLPDDYQDHVFTAWNLKGGVPTAYPVVLAKDGKITLMNPTSKAQWFEAGRAYNFNFNYHIG